MDNWDKRFGAFLSRSLSFEGGKVRRALRSFSFNGRDSEPTIPKTFGGGPLTSKERVLGTFFSFRSPSTIDQNKVSISATPDISHGNVEQQQQLPTIFVSPSKPRMQGINRQQPDNTRYKAALRLQKVYKSFRTRRQLADCAVLVEQRWWKVLDLTELKRSSISFFEIEKSESAISRWSRARTRAAKVGKGLSKDEKARKLALQHWLEAIDPRHRYGHNLQFYYVQWLQCESKQPFFYWLDIGEGKEVNFAKCPRSKLQQQCIKYLDPGERMAYEVTVEDGKFFHSQTRQVLDTRQGPEDTKWIFVLSTSRKLYVGQKSKGTFQHSSFLAGGATLSAGQLVVEDGILKAVWPHSGHYLPTEENFEQLMSYLEEHKVDLSSVMKTPSEEVEIVTNNSSQSDLARAIEEANATSSVNQGSLSRKFEIPSLQIPLKEQAMELFKKGQLSCRGFVMPSPSSGYNSAREELDDDDEDEEVSDEEISVSKENLFEDEDEVEFEEAIPNEKIIQRINSHKGMQSYQLAKQLSSRWTTGAGPRIGCVRDYPEELRNWVLEEVCLSPCTKISTPKSSSKPYVRTPSNLCQKPIPLSLEQNACREITTL